MLSLKKLSGAQFLGPPRSGKATVQLWLSERPFAWEIPKCCLGDWTAPAEEHEEALTISWKLYQVLLGTWQVKGTLNQQMPTWTSRSSISCKHLPSAHPARQEAVPLLQGHHEFWGSPSFLSIGNKQRFKIFVDLISHFCLAGGFFQRKLFKWIHAKWQLR